MKTRPKNYTAHKRAELRRKVQAGTIRAADKTETTVYVYYEPYFREHAHGAKYELTENGWECSNEVAGDMHNALDLDEHTELYLLALLGICEFPVLTRPQRPTSPPRKSVHISVEAHAEILKVASQRQCTICEALDKMLGI